MKILNRQYRGLDRTTDVLSFPQQESYKLIVTSDKLKKQSKDSLLVTRYSLLLLGDIVVNLHKAKRQAAENGITFYEELTRLLIHGLLHLIGYDHGKSSYQKKKMESKERELLKAFKTK